MTNAPIGKGWIRYLYRSSSDCHVLKCYDVNTLIVTPELSIEFLKMESEDDIVERNTLNEENKWSFSIVPMKRLFAAPTKEGRDIWMKILRSMFRVSHNTFGIPTQIEEEEKKNGDNRNHDKKKQKRFTSPKPNTKGLIHSTTTTNASTPNVFRSNFLQHVRKGELYPLAALLKKGVSPNFLDIDGKPPLLIAVETGDTHIVRLLMKSQKINVNIP